MSEHHTLATGANGAWEVPYYRELIAAHTAKGSPAAVVESLHRKLARAVERFGDPEAAP